MRTHKIKFRLSDRPNEEFRVYAVGGRAASHVVYALRHTNQYTNIEVLSEAEDVGSR